LKESLGADIENELPVKPRDHPFGRVSADHYDACSDDRNARIVNHGSFQLVILSQGDHADDKAHG